MCAQLASPLRRGTFQRAIIQSGSCVSNSLTTAESNGEAFARAAGCSDVACLRSKPAHDLLAIPAANEAWFLTWGGRELPVSPAAAVASGRFNPVPVINGSNHDEGRTFAQDLTDLTEAHYEQFVRDNFGGDADAILAQYPFSAFPSPYTSAYAIGAIWTDSGTIGGIGGCAALALDKQLAAYTRTYAYQFDDRHAPRLNNNHSGCMWGAGHAMELPTCGPASTTASRWPPSSRAPSGSCRARWCCAGGRWRASPRRSGRPTGRGQDLVAAARLRLAPDQRGHVLRPAQVRLLGVARWLIARPPCRRVRGSWDQPSD